MLDVDVPSLLRPHKPSTRARQDGLDAGNCVGSDRLLTCALAGLSNLLVFAFVSLLGAWVHVVDGWLPLCLHVVLLHYI